MSTKPRWLRGGRAMAASCGVLLAAAGAPGIARAQAWPAKPVTLIVPFPPGGTTDILARALADPVSAALGQPLVIESKPGAGATLGADYVARAKPDGYTLLMGAIHHTIAGSVYPKLGYDFERDFTPVTTVAQVPNVLTVNAAVPVNDVPALIAMLKAAPGKYAYGSNGNGTAQHLLGTQFMNVTGTRMLHVPYKGSAQIVTDLLGGQVALSFDTVTPVLPFVKSGKLRPLAVTTPTRSAALPDVPTFDEVGLKGFDVGTWFGVLAPVATPAALVTRLNAEMVKAIQGPDFRRRMTEIGADGIGDTPAQMAARIGADTARFAKLVRESGLKLE